MNETKEIVPLHLADVKRNEKVTLYDGLIANLPGHRRLEVWKIKGDDGICIRIFQPTNDGKVSKLLFGLSPEAGLNLTALLNNHFGQFQTAPIAPEPEPPQEAA